MNPSSAPRPLALPILPGQNLPLELAAFTRESRSCPGRTWVQLAVVDANGEGMFLAGDMIPLESN